MHPTKLLFLLTTLSLPLAHALEPYDWLGVYIKENAVWGRWGPGVFQSSQTAPYAGSDGLMHGYDSVCEIAADTPVDAQGILTRDTSASGCNADAVTLNVNTGEVIVNGQSVGTATLTESFWA